MIKNGHLSVLLLKNVSDNCGKTLLFNGEDDHKVPSTSRALLDGDMFRVVGRMIGHTFINGGPLYSGLSPAFFLLLTGRKDDTPVLELKDCPDMDVIEVVSLVCISFFIYKKMYTFQVLPFHTLYKS